MLLTLSVPENNEHGPPFMDQVLQSLSGPLRDRRETLRLGIGLINGYVTCYADVSQSLENMLRTNLYAQYKQCSIDSVAGDPFAHAGEDTTWTLQLRVVPELFPIKRHGQERDRDNRKPVDQLAALREMIGNNPELNGRFEMLVRPANPIWRNRARDCLRIREGAYFRRHPQLQSLYTSLAMSRRAAWRIFGFALGLIERDKYDRRHDDIAATSTRDEHQYEHEVQGAAEKFKDHNLYEVEMRLRVKAPSTQAHQAKRRLHDLAGVLGVFAERQARIITMRRCSSRRSLLSCEELANLWHPPTVNAETAGTLTSGVAELQPPVDLPILLNSDDAEVTMLGQTVYRGTQQRFGMLLPDRRLHTWIIGKTGMGKTTLLKTLIQSDIVAGRGVIVIDPHGDMIDDLLPRIPQHRQDDVVLFDAGNPVNPLSYNPFDCGDPERAHRIASDMTATFRKLFGDTAVGHQSSMLLFNAATVLIGAPGTSLVSLEEFLINDNYREEILLKAPDSRAKRYWLESFVKKPVKLQEEMIAPLQNKISQFTRSPIIEGIIGQPKNRLHIRRIMDEGKILLCKLSKGAIGELEAGVLGSFLISDVQISTLQREDTPEPHRRDCFLYIDELQNYCTESLATILSEARKYHLIMGGLAFQFIDQLDHNTRRALFGNAQTQIAFQLGSDDARIIEQQFAGRVSFQDLLDLPPYHAYLRMMLLNRPRSPFLMQTEQLPALPPQFTNSMTEPIPAGHTLLVN